MWATSSPSQAEQNTRRGFTIVELLIVIVVIGILAAIVIVAYNGVTQQARVASIKSDLDGAVKQLSIDQVNNSAYPATVAAANNDAGLKASPGTTYQYAVDNSASPQTFCITATNGTTSYFVSSTNNVATAGACAGQGSGGVAAITNMVANPSFESNVNTWESPGGNESLTVSSAHSFAGSNSLQMQATMAFNGAILVRMGFGASLFPISGNTQVFESAYVYTPVAHSIALYAIYKDTSGNYLVEGSSAPYIAVPANVWTRLTATVRTPVGAGSMGVGLIAGDSFNAGDVVYADGFMLVNSTSTYTYADGSSSNWVWNGTPNASTSTGPPL